MALSNRELPASVDDLFEIHFDTAQDLITLCDRNLDCIRGRHADGSFRDDKTIADRDALHAILEVLSRLGHRFAGTTDIDEAVHGIWVLRRVESEEPRDPRCEAYAEMARGIERQLRAGQFGAALDSIGVLVDALQGTE